MNEGKDLVFSMDVLQASKNESLNSWIYLSLIESNNYILEILCTNNYADANSTSHSFWAT